MTNVTLSFTYRKFHHLEVVISPSTDWGGIALIKNVSKGREKSLQWGG
jgi:hypothetical protein